MSFWKKKEVENSAKALNQAAQPKAVASQVTSSGAVAPRVTSTAHKIEQAAHTHTVNVSEGTNSSSTTRLTPNNSMVATSKVGAQQLTDKLSERFGNVRSVLGPQTRIDGKICFDSSVRIDGTFSGEVLSSKLLLVGTTGIITGEIETETLVIAGIVRANVHAFDKVVVMSGGILEGNVYSPVLVIEENATFNGASFNPEFDDRRGEDSELSPRELSSHENSDASARSEMIAPKLATGVEFAAAMH